MNYAQTLKKHSVAVPFLAELRRVFTEGFHPARGSILPSSSRAYAKSRLQGLVGCSNPAPTTVPTAELQEVSVALAVATQQLSQDYYQLLGVPADADAETLRQGAQQRIDDIRRAYLLLKDTQQRQDYDQTRPTRAQEQIEKVVLRVWLRDGVEKTLYL